MVEQYYLINKSFLEERLENIKLDVLDCQKNKNEIDEEKGIIEILTIQEIERNSKLLDLSNDNILTKGELYIEKQGIEANTESFFDGYVAALQDLKKQ